MLYTQDEVLTYVRNEDVRFIRLAFCDVTGVPKNISMMSTELVRAFRDGISFDASAIRGFGDEARSDLFLFPDAMTLSILPWRPSQDRVARMFCEIRRPDGAPYECDTRHILKSAVRQAKEKGLMCCFGAEFEFYLFKTDANGAPTKIPLDTASYMDMAPEDAGENVRREICLTLAEMGIEPESSHHEEGPGQNEIDFKYSDALSAADNAMTVKTVIKTVAARHGLYASFAPKPIFDQPGSGMHINVSPVTAGGDCFYAFMAGILAHIEALTLFMNPLASSYDRLGGHKAPKFITWSPENRSQLIRIPAADEARTRIELRSPDAMANPYLAYALIILAGLDGIERRLAPPPQTDVNLYTTAGRLADTFKLLPQTLAAAREAAVQSALIRENVPKRILDTMLTL